MTLDPRQLRTYNVEYFSGAQGAVYVGDTWIDEITSFAYSRQHTKTPLYGYSSLHWDGIADGRVMVQGSFTINFKESGYLFLALDRYQALMNGRSVMQELHKGQISWRDAGTTPGTPFLDLGNLNEQINRQNIEQIIDAEMNTFERNKIYSSLAASMTIDGRDQEEAYSQIGASLGGYGSSSRFLATRDAYDAKGNRKILGQAENVWEAFEDVVWAGERENFEHLTRSADDQRLNPFDIFLTYGDFVDNRDNHTIKRLTDVHVVGEAQQMIISGEPIQERYDFIARTTV